MAEPLTDFIEVHTAVCPEGCSSVPQAVPTPGFLFQFADFPFQKPRQARIIEYFPFSLQPADEFRFGYPPGRQIAVSAFPGPQGD